MEYTTKTYKGEGWTIIVKRPILSEAEREKREKYVVDTLKGVYREVAHDESVAKLLLAEGDETMEENQNLAVRRGVQ